MIIFISIIFIIAFIILFIIDKEISLKILDIVFSKDVAIELIKAIITAIFGYITFTIYQRYKNKKENSLLYIQVIKLQSELINNIKKLENIKNDYNEYSLLKEKFQNKKVYEIYKKIHLLNLFVDEDYIYDEFGQPIDVEYNYYEVPYQMINELENQISQEKQEEYINDNKIKDLESEIEILRKKSIFNELNEIEQQLQNLENQSYISLNFCFNEIKNFNLLSHSEKENSLNKFCKNLMDEENIFSKTLKLFDRLLRLENKLKKKNKKNPYNTISIKFEFWNTLEITLLAVYDANNFIILDEFYNKNKELEIGIWEKEVIDLLYKDINANILEIISNMKIKLEKILNITNSQFKNI